jgi:hypothetical protein
MLPTVFARERAQDMREVTTQRETADDENYKLDVCSVLRKRERAEKEKKKNILMASSAS